MSNTANILETPDEVEMTTLASFSPEESLVLDASSAVLVIPPLRTKINPTPV